MKRAWVIIAFAACSSSNQHKAPADQPAVVATLTKPPELMLPKLAKPLREVVELTLDPSSEDFAGTITTDLEILKPTSVLWLNAKEIKIDSATFTVNGAKLSATTLEGGKDYVGLRTPTPLAAGKATLAIAYHGKAHLDDGDGIYRTKEAGDDYLFTQFEATDARSAFPCFDEPSYKVPWQLTIHTKAALAAFANTSIVSETPEANGMKVVKFAETKPLPSYLVAFAVGPFETVDAGKTRTQTPIRIVVPRGRSKDAAYAASATAPLLALLEDYFGSPYPYDKLDMVAVPVFNAGAMENPGLITFRQELIVIKPSELTLDDQKAYAITAAHEMAHQWFGDYVTLAWWDDTWLNESFASWMEAKIVEQWKPEWQIDVDAVAMKGRIMAGDSLESARAIRQAIESSNDIANAFDGITYGKGEAVLSMLERWIGPDTFQKGVRAYLAAHAWGNATYKDFVAAMASATTGKPTAALFDAFVTQSGLPLVSFALDCSASPSLRLSQQRYAPTGSSIDPKRTWQIPVCVRWSADAKTGTDCTLLTAATGTLALSAPSCPTWVEPNQDGVGYYRTQPDGPMLQALIAATDQLTLAERVSLLSDVDALAANGVVDKGVALELVGKLAKDKSRQLAGASIGVVSGIDDDVPENLRPNYIRFVRKLYSERAHELGWRARPGDDDNIKELRGRLVGMVAEIGEDAELTKQATELTWKWLDDHKAVAPDLVDSVLSAAARTGDQKLFDRFHAEAKKATDRSERERLISAMGSFYDPKMIEQALALSLTDEFDMRESQGLFSGAFARPATRERAYQWTVEHFDQLTAKLPEPFRAYMAFTFVPICDDTRKPEIEKFFKPRIEKFDGGPRMMAQALEELSLCSAQRKAQAPGISAFLEKQ
ncbi:MAG TPA: M1 family metallopeptidase [Kofleriaceae bacterium]|nr:M1 family metallopeptidase [Kofleriaceae bacterium]